MALSWESPAAKPVRVRFAHPALGRMVSGLATVLASMPARFIMVAALGLGGVAAVFANADVATSVVGLSPQSPAFEQTTDIPATSGLVAASPPLSVDVPLELLMPVSAGEAGPLRREAALAPVDLCDVIQAGSASTGWVESPVYPGEWECLSNAPRGKAKATSFSIFAMARGMNEDHVGYVRFKISAETDADAEKGAGEVARRFEALFTALHWAIPEKSFLSIRLLKPFDLDDGGTKIRFMKEVLQEGRYNLIVTFPSKTPAMVAQDRRTLPLPPNPLQDL